MVNGRIANEKPINKRLGNQRKKKLQKIICRRYAICDNRKLIDFLSLYIDCEATAKKYVYYYKADKKQKNSNTYEGLKYDEVGKAARYFALEINADLIKKIFESSTGIRNHKTPRQLRNGVVHSKSIKDIEEIELRFDELLSLMNTWIDIVKRNNV